MTTLEDVRREVDILDEYINGYDSLGNDLQSLKKPTATLVNRKTIEILRMQLDLIGYLQSRVNALARCVISGTEICE